MIRTLIEKLKRARHSNWADVLPLQSPRDITIADPRLANANDLPGLLQARKLIFHQGGNWLYLPPASLGDPLFNSLRNGYPADAGLKIGLEFAETSRGGRLNLIANALHLQEIGSRLYDRIVLTIGNEKREAFVIQHVAGKPPEQTECDALMGKLQALETGTVLKNMAAGGYQHADFQCPACNGKARVADARTHYVAFQNFELADYGGFLEKLAAAAAAETHFGNLDRRGSRYLYQTIPGVRLPGKRNVEERMALFQKLMAEMRVSPADRLVLDIGCNLGMMMGQYLKSGARWCHGWDMPGVTQHTERMLLALGCTRFSTTGTTITASQAVERELPPFLQPHLNGCVVSYLAIRGHVGWLDALGRIPWSFLLYEGHKPDSADDFQKHISELKKMVDFKVGPIHWHREGKSRPRLMTVLVRQV